ncbi:sulfatase-like hydrolase/transferase [Peristeroidobacter soli]|jgi:N-acetylglucosamine-6-sulfatase|uniref:sulfatase-like hydrolase/transferase n=1 Tax=Peristeroidobacter soli TaxID=2497877 RepID=UPI00101BB787|nr:sulfatase-like hydrolase/transferase [Peristeroidobacter soli]
MRFPRIGLGLFASFLFLGITLAHAQTSATPPNIIVVLIDELRYDEVDPSARHPFVKLPNIDRLANEGMSFRQFYSVSTICSPNRATLLTGQHPAIHGVIDNTDRSALGRSLLTFPLLLQQSGYETAYVGKWHMGNDPSPRPGFDFWAALPGQGKLWNPEIWKQGRLQQVEGYVTDVLTDEALDFVRRPRKRPFLLYLAHKAIHPDAHQLPDGSVDLSYGMRYEPAARHSGRYRDVPISLPQAAATLSEDLKGKPVLARALDARNQPEIQKTWGELLGLDAQPDTVRRRAEMLLSIDEGLGRVLDELKRQKRLDNTLIIFTSDNGTNWGEHGLTLERRLPYEPVIHLPLIVYYKPWMREGRRVNDNLTLQIDIAPTVLAAAGLPQPPTMQGHSLEPLLTAKTTPWRDSFLIEHAPDERPFSWLLDLSYVAVRQQHLKLIHWLKYPEESELYDLSKDPGEQHNLIKSPDYAPRLPALQAELKRLVLEARSLE